MPSSSDTIKCLPTTFSLTNYLDSNGLVYLVLHWESVAVPAKASLNVKTILVGVTSHDILKTNKAKGSTHGLRREKNINCELHALVNRSHILTNIHVNTRNRKFLWTCAVATCLDLMSLGGVQESEQPFELN